MKTPKYLPCPFCGSKKISHEHENSVECEKCPAQVCIEWGNNSRKDAIKAWNRRA